MLSVIISVLISVGFLVEAVMTGKVEPSAKTVTIAESIRKLLLFVPAMVGVLFAVLLSTVLKGRLLERSSHAIIVLCFWIYGTAFYINILKFFKNRTVLIISIIGMMVSVSFAILLTPLDRYCTVMFASIHELAFVLGGVMLVLWYISSALIPIKNKK